MLEHEDVQLNENLEEYTPNQPSVQKMLIFLITVLNRKREIEKSF